MTRKMPVLPALLLLALGSTMVPAQEPTKDDVRITRGLLAAERQKIVGENLSLTPEQAQKFWPLYLQYRGELMRFGDRGIQLLDTLSKSGDTMDDKTAQGLLEEWLFLKQQEWELKARWRARFERAIPPAKVLRLYQIENKIDTSIAAEISSAIPLALPAK